MAMRRNSIHSYEDGNAARNIGYERNYNYDYEEADDERAARRREKVDNLHERRVKRQARVERANASRLRMLEKSKGITLVSCIAFVVCTVVMYNLASSYLEVNSSITAAQKEIVKVESECDALKARNDSKLEEINSGIDLKEIYDVATNELGMVFAGDNQIVEFDDNEASYVRNYEDIPDTLPDNVYDDILASID